MGMQEAKWAANLGQPSGLGIGRRDGHELWAPTEVGLSTDRARITWAAASLRPVVQVRTDARMVERFAKLATGSPEQVAGFARQYGVLGLCEHGHPRHEVGPLGADGQPVHGPGDDSCSKIALSESVAHWRTWAARSAAILTIAAGLVRDNRATPEQWRAVGEGEPPWLYWPARRPANIYSERLMLARAVDRWVALGGVRVRADLGADGQVVPVLAGEGLFGAVGMQLLLAVSRSGDLALCPKCMCAFAPENRRRRYCDDCANPYKRKTEAARIEAKRAAKRSA
jgi:hypothetical protein